MLCGYVLQIFSNEDIFLQQKNSQQSRSMGILRFRRAKPGDLETCRSLIHPGLRMKAEVRRALVDIWQDFIASETVAFCLVEDLSLPHPRSIETFAAGVFVSEEFARSFLAKPQPYLSALIYEEILANRSPVLTLPQIGRANSGRGLYSVTLHFDFRQRDFSSPRMLPILAASAESGYFFRMGYRLNAYMGEVHGRQAASYLRSAGLGVIEFPDQPCAGSAGFGPDDVRPYLVFQCKEDVQPSLVHRHARFFYTPPPILGFSLAERRVLERTLLNESDAEIADDLAISFDAVKKTWRHIFERVDRVASHLIPVGEGPPDRRGREKRRHLLHYLQTHLEELRPYSANSSKRDG